MDISKVPLQLNLIEVCWRLRGVISAHVMIVFWSEHLPGLFQLFIVIIHVITIKSCNDCKLFGPVTIGPSKISVWGSESIHSDKSRRHSNNYADYPRAVDGSSQTFSWLKFWSFFFLCMMLFVSARWGSSTLLLRTLWPSSLSTNLTSLTLISNLAKPHKFFFIGAWTSL